MKVLLIFLILTVFDACIINAEIEHEEIYINCATPCIPRNNCYFSTCDTSKGICVEEVKDILPAECCFSASDCRTGDCVFTSCNLDVNQCEYIEICPNSGFNITKKACINDNQCQGDNPCSLSKCIDNVCQNSPLTNPNNDLCCEDASECLSYPCTESFCDVESFTCFYVPIPGCIISFGDSIIHPTSDYYQSSSSSSSTYSTYEELYGIPDNPDAGAIFFLILGCLILLLVVIISVTAIVYTIHDYFWGDKPLPHDIGEAAAAGHTDGHGAH